MSTQAQGYCKRRGCCNVLCSKNEGYDEDNGWNVFVCIESSTNNKHLMELFHQYSYVSHPKSMWTWAHNIG